MAGVSLPITEGCDALLERAAEAKRQFGGAAGLGILLEVSSRETELWSIRQDRALSKKEGVRRHPLAQTCCRTEPFGGSASLGNTHSAS